MKKRLILVAAPPAHGKNYVSALLCRALDSVAYFDKDELAPLLSRAFSLSGEAFDMDGGFYREHLRAAEYETLMGLAFSALRFSDTVLVNAPLSREVRDLSYMQALKARAADVGASLILLWVSASDAVCYERMKQRAAKRDEKKLLDFAAYSKAIDTSVPTALSDARAVDALIVVDNEDEKTVKESVENAVRAINNL
jgi:predicted kinase